MDYTTSIASTDTNVVVSIDAMGGDKGPSEIVAGLLLSAKQYSGIRFLVHGPKVELAPLIKKIWNF